MASGGANGSPIQTSTTPGQSDSKTLWVGDIENWMDENYVANLFSKMGSVTNAKIIRDKSSGAPMGYGFVEFTSHEIAARVLQLFNGSINPGTGKLNWGVFGGNANKGGDRGPPRGDRNDRSMDQSRSGGGDRDRERSRNDSNTLNRRNPSNDNTYQVHVGDLDISVSKQQLMDHFKKKYHSVVDAKIPQDNATRISRGYGFVHFTNYEESQKSINEMNGSLLKGKPIKVNHASSKNTTTQGSTSGGSNHPRGNSYSGNNQSVLGQIYGNGYVGSPTGGQRGGPILGGLGVQFKPNEQLGQHMMAIPPQQYTYINPATGQPIQAGFAVSPNAAQLYAHQLAAAGQQGLIYGYPQAAMGKPPGSVQTDPLTGSMMTTDPATLHALGLSAAGGGLYSAAHLGVLNPHMAGHMGYQFYIPQAGLMPGQPQAWGLPPVTKEDHSAVIEYYPSLKSRGHKSKRFPWKFSAIINSLFCIFFKTSTTRRINSFCILGRLILRPLTTCRFSLSLLFNLRFCFRFI